MSLSSTIVKGGALVDDTMRLVAAWDWSASSQDNLDHLVGENALGLPSQSRAEVVVRRVLAPRYVEPGPCVLRGLDAARSNRDAFRDACMFEATRNDELLARFAEEAIPRWYEAGRLEVDVELVLGWLDLTANEGSLPEWSDSLRRRVAQGLIATMRDFGRLVGATNSKSKEIARPGISVGGFAYVAYRLHEQGESSRGILTSRVWRRWLLDDQRVDELMHQLVSRGVLYYSAVGSTLRIDWRVHTLQEVVHAAA